jgi:hypothetical protein
MKAALVIVIDRKVVFPDGAILQMLIWHLPEAGTERPHGLKYRFYYGLPDGLAWCGTITSVASAITGTSDREEPYQFVDIETFKASRSRIASKSAKSWGVSTFRWMMEK